MTLRIEDETRPPQPPALGSPTGTGGPRSAYSQRGLVLLSLLRCPEPKEASRP